MSQTSSTPATIALKSGVVTSIEVLIVSPEQQAVVVEHMRRLVQDVLQQQPGLVSASVHQSWDGTHVVNYMQWANTTSYERMQNNAMFEQEHSRLLPLVRSVHQDLYDVVYTDDHTPGGITTITQEYDGDTFINVISTSPEQQQALVTFVTGNDTQVFAVAPGYRSANFHRSHDGTKVINYSHWDNQQAFLDAINTMFQVPELTTEQANALAIKIAAGQGQTDFRFYEVVLALSMATKQA